MMVISGRWWFFIAIIGSGMVSVIVFCSTINVADIAVVIAAVIIAVIVILATIIVATGSLSSSSNGRWWWRWVGDDSSGHYFFVTKDSFNCYCYNTSYKTLQFNAMHEESIRRATVLR